MALPVDQTPSNNSERKFSPKTGNVVITNPPQFIGPLKVPDMPPPTADNGFNAYPTRSVPFVEKVIFGGEENVPDQPTTTTTSSTTTTSTTINTTSSSTTTIATTSTTTTAATTTTTLATTTTTTLATTTTTTSTTSTTTTTVATTSTTTVGTTSTTTSTSTTTTTLATTTSTSTTTLATTTTTTLATTTTTVATTTTTVATTSTTTTAGTTSTTTTTTNGAAAQFFKVGNWRPSTPNQYGWVYLPPNYDSELGGGYSFMVFLHGQGQSGSGSAGADDLINEIDGAVCYYLNLGDEPEDIIIFCPQLSSGTWEPNWVEDARTYLVNTYNVDTTRFYLTGLSLGGTGTGKYVGSNPDKVAAFLIATGDTQFLENGVEDDVINGVRVADVPGWFHGGIADATISVNNGYAWMTADNALSPKPIYTPLVNTYWGIGHTSALWNTQVYNRKNRTDATGTAVFDYIDWFKRFKINDLAYNATSHVGVAENTLLTDKTAAWQDYRIALRLVNLMPSGSVKTDLLNRLAAVKTSIETDWTVVELSFGSTTVSGVNILSSVNDGQSVNNMLDISGNPTTIDFTLNTTVWDGQVNIGTGNEYLGMPTEFWANGWRIYNTASNTCTIAGLNSSSTHVVRFIYGDMTQTTTTQFGARVTISSTTKDLLNEIQNTNKYVDFTDLTGSTTISATLEPIVAGEQGDIAGIIIFESNTPGTTTTTVATTTTTTLGTTTTSTTLATTTTTTIATTSTTTTTLATTTTTTTADPNIAQFNFNPTAQSIAGWTDVSGQPDTNVLSATHSGTGITVSSVSITSTWGSFGTPPNTSAGSNGATVANPSFIFPAEVTQTYWFNYQKLDNGSNYNLEIGGLNVTNQYRIDILASRAPTADPDRLVDFYCIDDSGRASELGFNVLGNTANLVTFDNKIPITGGLIRIGIYQPDNGNGTNNYEFGYLNGLRVTNLGPIATTTTTSSTTTTTVGTTTTTTTLATTTTTTLATTTTTLATTTTTTTTTTVAGIAQFNFNMTAQSIAGWNDVSGNPHEAQRTATDSATNIGVRSLGALDSNLWQAFGGNTSNNVNGEDGSNAEFPATVIDSFWFNESAVYVGNKNVEIFGLTPGNSYDIHMIGSRAAAGLTPTKVMAFYCEDANGTTSNTTYNAKGNLTTIQMFTNQVAKPDGTIQIGIFPSPTSDGTNDTTGYLNGMRVLPA